MSSWYNKKEEEIIQRLKNTLESESLQFIGKFTTIEDKDFGFFKDVRSVSGVRKYYPTDEGEPDDFNNRPLEVWSKKTILFNNGRKKIILEEGKWYKFYAVPAQSPFRLKNRNPFLLQTDLSRAVDISLFKGNELIENIQQDSINTPESVKGKLTRSIEAISNEINTQPATFIFELIQNADDYPNDKKYVKMSFDIRAPYLIIKHNGSEFDVNNAVAICDINEGDKRSEVEKIGFKGIGFKSIFKDCNLAYLKSGEYSFRFDEIKWRNEGRKLFWQITPINTDEKEYQNILSPFNNVNLIIKPKEQKQLSNYKYTLLEHFKDERILLFLRNVKEIDFILNDDSFSISNTENKWRILKSKNIIVEDSIRDGLNRGIALNDKRIPLKYQSIEKTEIGFGFLVNENKVQNVNDATIYAYLPTKVNLGFGFLLNGNFIPDGSRTHLHQDLTWNDFLFEKAGEIFLNKLIELIENGIERSSVINLIPNFGKLTDINDDEKIQFINAFKKGFDKKISTIQFIPTELGNLESLSNILIDETGLAELLGKEFSKLTGITEKLIDTKLGEGVLKIKNLIEQNGVGIIYDKGRLKVDIQTKLQDWLKLPLNNFKFIEYLNSNDSLKSLLNSEDIILSSDGVLYKAPNLFAEVPNEIIFLLPKKVNNEVLNLIKHQNIKLDFKKFEPVPFLSESILGKEKAFNVGLDNKTNLLDFWQFVFNNWDELESDKAIVNSLKSIEIQCKSSTPDLFLKCLISNSYLSAEFNSSNEIESTVRSIIQDALFISENYISKNGDEIKWRKIFYKLGVIGDLQKTIDDLLPKLSSISEQQHFLITKQIFKYWRDNREKESGLNKDQIELIKNSLKLKCIDDIYRQTSECIISDHYQTNKIITTILGEVNLTNQISSDYTTNQISDWNTFFKGIGCKSLDEKQLVLDEKISFIVSHQDTLQESHFEYINGISTLYNARYTNGLKFDFVNKLSKLKLKTVDDDFKMPFDMHLSSIYNPNLLLENENYLGKKIYFLSIEYYANKVPTKFFIKMGVNDDFKFLPIIESIHIDKLLDKNYLKIFLSMKRYLERYNVIVRSYAPEKILSVSTIRKHITLNYDFIFTNPKYLPKFWEFLLKDNTAKQQLAIKTELRIWNDNIYPNDNHVLNKIKTNETVLAGGSYKKPIDLFSRKLIKYLESNECSDIDFSEIYVDEEKTLSLEELLGIRQNLSAKHVISILSKEDISLTEDDVKDLNIIEILAGIIPENQEYEGLKFLNILNQWKPINELFIIKEAAIQLNPNQQLHELFYSIANNFGINELSEQRLIIKTNPDSPNLTDDINSFFKEKSKFIAYKIDQIDWEETETKIIDTIVSYKYYEVNSISKVFPSEEPIYEQILDFHYNDENQELLYKGNWKSNKNIISFLHSEINNEKLEPVWFENIINRWDDKKIIETLVDMFGTVPSDWQKDDIRNSKDNDSELNQVEKDDFWAKLTEEDIIFIRGIIAGDYELNDQLDYNTTAKIKTLMAIKSQYSSSEISDEGRFLKAGNDEIIVRSAQKGLLFLDLNHWNRLEQMRVYLSVYTNNEVMIFENKQSLFEFIKPKNKYGITKMPDDYDLEDLNSINKPIKKGVWRFVFIVNENTKAAESYIKGLDYSDPDLFDDDNF